MKKLTIFLTVFLLVALIAVPAGAWTIDSKDYDWRGEHKFNQDVIFKNIKTADFSGATDFDFSQAYDIPLRSFWIGTSFAELTASTAPAYTASNTIDQSIQWASDSTISIISEYMRVKPWMTGSGMAFRGLARFSATTGTSDKTLNWGITVQANDGSFSTSNTQTAASISAYPTSNRTFTLTPNATAQALLLSGTWFKITLWPTANQSAQSGILSLMGLEYYKP